MTAARYLQRYRADIEENFLARKHVTQVRVFKLNFDTLKASLVLHGRDAVYAMVLLVIGGIWPVRPSALSDGC